ncbi:MAG TPA: AAA family ATPase [Dokdonella sp.]|uniref:AAA family ATPase n=1 Tax=Dokdonella sp. TaxID=2291710 RepID=UPI002C31EAAE|nr:AAA family ATPase [Dokdonella sp.]HUD40751.1 AAA family ATPase [Dokdonella sp.]
MKGAKPVYDERFHRGVNVIRGENSSGKSTILNFIHYGLGGDVHNWSETALLCDRVFIEAHLNGKVAVLSRLVSQASQQPMEIYFGSLDNSMQAPLEQWGRFPYRRSQSKESFSQVLFRLLEIPEITGEDSGNITMHQVMRLLYADQLSPVDEIFAHEGFDNPKTRDAVGRLLCGAFDAEMYSIELQIRDTDRKFDQISSELNSLYRALGQAGHSLTLDWVGEERLRSQEDRRRVEADIIALQKSTMMDETERPSLAAQHEAYSLIVEKQKEIAAAREKRDSLQLAIADSAVFIESLQDKLVALKDSELVAQEIGIARFSSCPACYTELSEVDIGICSLCKQPFDPELVGERIGALINDTAIQLRQSKLLQENRRSELALAEAVLIELDSEWKNAAQKYAEIRSRPTSEYQHKLSELNKRLGYLERRDEDLDEKARMIAIVSSLSEQKLELNTLLALLRERHEQLKATQMGRLSDAYYAISEKVRGLLAKDLKRQDSFENPQKVDFSFSENRISVDGHTYFSASSRAILKSAFLLGFFAAATEKEFFRHPRFTMLDTIEDKGMEPARSRNFQRLIVAAVEQAHSQGQVIFGTAMIAEELDNESYTVGRFYTRDHPSLDFSYESGGGVLFS